VIQTRKYKNQKVKAVVIRTGYLTSKGDLVRSILYPPPVDFQFESDSYKFILVLAFIATLGMAYTLAKVIIFGSFQLHNSKSRILRSRIVFYAASDS
jgi:cation-transporting ATPase 13A3/4/5